MKEKIDDIEQILEGELDKEARIIKADLEKNPLTVGLTDEAKQRMKANIDKGIEDYNKEAVYSRLSEEDREALELGKRMKAQQDVAQKTGTDCESVEEIEIDPKVKKVVRKKRNWKVLVSLAAVLVMTLAGGVNSFGGPDRLVKVIREQIGGREVSKVNTAKDTAKSSAEKEEKAYQEIEKTFGIQPVRITVQPSGMKFKTMEVDELLQIINFIYTYDGQSIIYCVTLDYAAASWGADVEDKKAIVWKETVKNCQIQVKEYETLKKNDKRYSAQFIYKDIGYTINGTMEKEDFMIIINNLHFL